MRDEVDSAERLVRITQDAMLATTVTVLSDYNKGVFAGDVPARIIAAARKTNFGSRTVLGAIGMREIQTFEQRGYTMILYESFVAGRTSDRR